MEHQNRVKAKKVFQKSTRTPIIPVEPVFNASSKIQKKILHEHCVKRIDLPIKPEYSKGIES
jgi:hypothetical protein